ncbi:hypothetical protein V1279_007178 [Bradyrhizobium sp. AZCC 1610]|uniref:hypothetical protein n=1 Tax=Bradyrhizobium sp. AZCC 1610 TaxID=3117020 RepID=UPI002FEF9E33
MPLHEFWHHKDNGWWGSAVALAQMAALAAAYPIKRTFDRPFGRVITRYGETGNTEKFHRHARRSSNGRVFERGVQAEK